MKPMNKLVDKQVEKLVQAIREWISEKPWEYDQVVNIIYNRDEQA